MHDLTRRSLAAVFAGSMLFGAAACGDDDDGVDVDTEEIEDDIQETGDEIDEEFDENVDIGDDAEQQGGE